MSYKAIRRLLSFDLVRVLCPGFVGLSFEVTQITQIGGWKLKDLAVHEHAIACPSNKAISCWPFDIPSPSKSYEIHWTPVIGMFPVNVVLHCEFEPLNGSHSKRRFGTLVPVITVPQGLSAGCNG